MLSKTNIYTDNWVDMVFEDRNQEYGAFVLRKKSTHNTMLAVILAIVFFGLMITAPMIANYFTKEEDTEFVAPVVSNEPLPPKPIDDIKEELPPPPPPPPLKTTFKFVVAEVVKDAPEEPEQRIMDDLIDKPIGKDDVKGDDDAPDILPDIPDGPVGGGTDAALDFVQQMPEFPGGEKELQKFLKANLSYPNRALENGIQGRVFVGFIVEKDGSITDIKIVGKNTFGSGLEEEALRVVKIMPKWKEGKQNGNAVRVKFTLPINFKLER